MLQLCFKFICNEKKVFTNMLHLLHPYFLLRLAKIKNRALTRYSNNYKKYLFTFTMKINLKSMIRVVWGNTDRGETLTDCPCVDTKSNFTLILTYNISPTTTKQVLPLVCRNCSLFDFYARIFYFMHLSCYFFALLYSVWHYLKRRDPFDIQCIRIYKWILV